MRQHHLSNRAFKDTAEIDAGTAESWNTLTPERFISITATGWIMRES